jgi:DNA-binding SARP family transcriptional activator
MVGLLGPLRLTGNDGAELRVGAPKERAVVAMLGLRAGTTVAIWELIEALWGEDPPASATKAIQTYVSSLRRLLPAGAIETVTGGYRLDVDPNTVDVVVFEQLVATARQTLAAGDSPSAVGSLRQALALWRGQPLVELTDHPWGAAEAVRLMEARRDCQELLAEARLASGEAASLVGELEASVAAEPLRERRWAQLMLALYRAGRQVEALRAFQRLRAQLSEQLGIEPSAELRQLEEAILLQKPELHGQKLHRVQARGGQIGAATTTFTTESLPEQPWRVPAPLARAVRRTLIGRRHELERLNRHLDDMGRTTGLVIIAGEPGVGKTRLAAAVAHQAHQTGILVWHGRCDEGLHVPYQPFVEALTSYIDTAAADKLAAQLSSGGRELSRLLPDLTSRLAGLPPPTSSDPETERWLLFQAATKFIQSIAMQQPVVLIIDDLHWAEPATLLLLRHVARAAIEGLLVVATARTMEPSAPDAFAEALAELAREHRLDTLVLSGLSDDEVNALLADRLQRPADTTFAQATYEETGGNPFYIHELISHLTDIGLLAGSGDWPTAAQIEESGASRGVRQVLSRRISQLSPSTQDVLVVAAAAGAEFHVTEVAAAMIGDRHALSCLEEAAASGLLTESPGWPGGYRFAHALVRHTLYDEISALRRTELHWRIAEAIREADGFLDRRLNELAYHYRRSLPTGDPAVAMHWLGQAGDQAARQIAFEEAIEHYRAALAALDLCSNDPERRYHFLVGLAESAVALSDFDVSQPAWLAAADIARTMGDRARFIRAVVEYGTLIRTEVEDPSFVQLIDEGLKLVGPGDSGERAQLLALDASTLYRGGSPHSPHERERRVREALAMAHRVGDRSAQSWALGSLGHVLLGSSRATELLAVQEEHLHAMEELGMDVERDSTYKRMALAAIQLGRRSDAENWLDRAETLARAGNRRIDLHNVLMVHSAMATAEGRFNDAKSIAAQTQELGGRHNLMVALAYSAQLQAIRAEEGRVDRIISDLSGLALDGSPVTMAWRAMLAGLYASVGHLDDAAVLFELLTPDGFSILPRDWTFPLAIRYLAELCTYFGDTEQAGQLLPEVRTYSGQLLVVTMGTSIEGAADRSLGQLYALLGRRDDADRSYESATRLEDLTGFPALAARTRYWHAQLLAQSDARNDWSRALILLEETKATTSALGMRLLYQQINDLAEGIRNRRPDRTL